MLKESIFYDLSLLSYFQCNQINCKVSEFITSILDNEQLQEEYKDREDYHQNLLALAKIQIADYEHMVVRDFIDDNTNSGIVYYVFENEDAFIIAIRGSEPFDALHHTTGWQDWKDNFRMFLKDPTWQQILTLHKIQQMEFDKPFYLCGHSKGGNLALYTALTMKEEMLKQCCGVVSFNAPGITKEIRSIYKVRADDEAFLNKITIFENENDCVSAFFENLKEPIFIKSQIPCNTLQQMYHNHNLYAMDFENNAYVVAKKKTAMPKFMYHFVNDFFVNMKEERLHGVVERMDRYFDSGLSLEELYKVLLYHISKYTSLFEDIPVEEIPNITFHDLMERRKTKILVQKVKDIQPKEALMKVSDTLKEKVDAVDIQNITQEIVKNYDALMEKTKDLTDTIAHNNERIISAITNIRNRNDDKLAND